MKIKKQCKNCNSAFEVEPNREKIGRGIYCSLECYREYKRLVGLSNEQIKRISKATKEAMRRPEVYEKFIRSFTIENRLRRSENTKKQMASVDKKDWGNKISSATKKKWKLRPAEEKLTILSQLSQARLSFKENLKNPIYRKLCSEKMIGVLNPFYGKKHTQETIEKLRKASTERLLDFWKCGELRGCNTKPEIEMQSLLNNKKVKFITPFVLKNKIYDLYLPDHNLIIEVDGCYWHSKNVQLDSMNEHQLRRWKNDRFKDSLAKRNGYKLIRVWEDEINKFDIEKELNYE